MRFGKLVQGRLFMMPKPYNHYMNEEAYSNLDKLYESDIPLANANGWYQVEEGGEGEIYELVGNVIKAVEIDG